MTNNTTIVRSVFAGVLFALCSPGGDVPSAATSRPTFRVVSSLNGLSGPWGLTEGSPGVFYGAATIGLDAAYSVTKQGVTTTLATFPTHYTIGGALVSGPNDLFYASVQHTVGSANIFSVGPAPGTLKVYSNQTVVVGLSQSLPDRTLLGFAANAYNQIPWSIVTVDLDGIATSVYQFPTDAPLSNEVYATDGNYYGIATGNSNYVFRVTPSGSFTQLYTFPAVPPPFGGAPPSSLVQAQDTNLYGILASGGANGTGAVFRLTLSGEYKVLYSFPAGPNGGPTALIEGSDGNLYGATVGYVLGGPFGYGLLFRLTTSGRYTLLKAMDNGGVTGSCLCSLLLGSDGIVYGTATIGGKSGGGTVFALDTGMPPPKPWARQFTPQSGSVGTQVMIYGSNLFSAAVEFNGVAATTVSNSGPNYLFATVPAGATSGPITVTTPGGTSTTRASFTVE